MSENYIKKLIEDSKGLDKEFPEYFVQTIENKNLKKFYSNDLNFTRDELVELINILSYIDNKYLIDALYLSKYYNYDIFHLLNPDLEQMLSVIKYKSIISFIENGCILCVKYFFTELTKIYDIYTLFMKACENGQLDIAKYLISLESTHGQIDIHIWNDSIFTNTCKDSIFSNVCRDRQLDIAKYLISLENTHGQIDIHVNNDSIFSDASGYKRLDIVNYLISLESTHGKIDR